YCRDNQRRLERVMTSVSDLLIHPDRTVRSALELLDRYALGFLLVVDRAGRLSGTLTDGDIRRALLRGASLDAAVEQVMQKNCVSLPFDASAEMIGRTLSRKIAFIPLLDGEGKPVDYATHGRHRRFPVVEPLLNGREADYVQE